MIHTPRRVMGLLMYTIKCCLEEFITSEWLLNERHESISQKLMANELTDEISEARIDDRGHSGIWEIEFGEPM